MLLPGREWQEGYRFGFQGQEQEGDNIFASSFFKFRIEDVRLGRFLSVDPIAKYYAYNSPYAFSENRLIDGREYEGLEFVFANPLFFSRAPIIFEETNTVPNVETIVRNINKTSEETGKPLERTVDQQKEAYKQGESQTKSSPQEGNEMHKSHKVDNESKYPGGSGNKRLPSGKNQPDFWYKYFDGQKWQGVIKELKPNNLSALNRGLQQVTRYADELSKLYPEVSKWTSYIETYEFVGYTIGQGVNTYNVDVDIFYSIQKGDNLTKIAKQFGTTVADLKEMNHLQSDLIIAGEQLYVKRIKDSTQESPNLN